MVRIDGSIWDGDTDRAYLMDDEEAIQLILDNNPDELDNWPHLQAQAAAEIETD